MNALSPTSKMVLETLAWLLLVVTVLSLMKLPPPKDPRLRLLWSVVIRFTFFAWNAWGPTRLKAVGVIVPSPTEWEDEPVTKKDPP